MSSFFDHKKTRQPDVSMFFIIYLHFCGTNNFIVFFTCRLKIFQFMTVVSYFNLSYFIQANREIHMRSFSNL